MARLLKGIYLLVALTFAPWGFAPMSSAWELGAKVADFRLSDTAGNSHSLSSYPGKVLVLALWSFKCPVSLAYDDRLAALQKKYHDQGVVVLAVASNANESAAEIERNVRNLNLPIAVLLDQDGTIAQNLGATHTPSIFILDRGSIVRYQGALDNNKRAGESGRIAYAEEALDAILAGRAVALPETRAFGCSIRR